MRDIQFNLYEVLDLEGLSNYPKYAEYNRELYDMVLEEARKFAVTALAPKNAEWDKEGCRLEDGQVITPTGMKAIYEQYCEGGWIAPSADLEVGGQGLPRLMTLATIEMFCGANPAFLIYPGLTGAAADLIQHFAPEDAELLLPLMNAGSWAGTMCLTEPGAGTAVGDCATKAVPTGDGKTYKIEGTKLFISGGDQDFTDNIIHLVLAKTPDAAPGAKGLSLFIVPKVRYDEAGNLGEANDVTTGGLEHKMGIHACSTCLLNFGTNGECLGTIVGNEGDGIRVMFHMMNEARNAVGVQSMAVGSAAYQASLAYAKERVQGVAWDKMKDPDAPRVAIVEHPDIRRNLLAMKCRVEAMRALTYRVAYYDDLAQHADDADRYKALCDILTPVVKARNSDVCYDVCTYGIQILGGYGYCGEYPLEQAARDAKIFSLYEGSNGIQALDLVGRKLTTKSGMLFMGFLGEITGLLEEAKAVDGLAAEIKLVEEARDKLAETTMRMGQAGMMGDRELPVMVATPYLEMFGDVVYGVLLVHQGAIAQKLLDAAVADAGCSVDELCAKNEAAKYYFNKVISAQFFTHEVLPNIHARAAAIADGNRATIHAKF
jgi:alkylation response protein AidB-like acyl-CoA dehydrogenase